MSVDIGWAAPIIVGMILFSLLVVLSLVFQVFWKRFWGNHDE